MKKAVLFLTLIGFCCGSVGASEKEQPSGAERLMGAIETGDAQEAVDGLTQGLKEARASGRVNTGDLYRLYLLSRLAFLSASMHEQSAEAAAAQGGDRGGEAEAVDAKKAPNSGR